MEDEKVSKKFLLRWAQIASSAVIIILWSTIILYSQEIIDPRSGRLLLTETDLVLQAGPVNLEVQRTLQTEPSEQGVLGTKWRLNWESSLFHSEKLIVIKESSGPSLFTKDPSKQEYKSNSGERVVFDKNGNAFRTKIDGIIETFDTQGRLIKRDYRNGNIVTFHYGVEGRLSRIERPKGNYINLITSKEGRLDRIETSAGTNVQYTYADDELIEVRVNGGSPVKYRYNEKVALVRIERPISGVVELIYDLNGRVSARWWADGSTEYYEYDDANRTVRHKDATGGITIIRRSEDGRHEEITDPLGNTTVIKYDEAFRPVAITGPTGATSRKGYDSLGRVVLIEGCCGSSSRLEYVGESSRYRSITENDGTRYDFTYDERGNILSIKRDGEVTHAFTYSPDGLIKSIKGEGIPERKYTYYPNGLVKSETDALGHTISYEYDTRGNKTREIDPLGSVTVRKYNDQNRVVSLTDPVGATTSYTYDAAGRTVSVTDPTGGVNRYEYDSRGRLLSTADPAGRITRYQYDAAGRLLSETDPAGYTYRYDYDLVGNLIREINPSGGVTTRAYNPLNLMVSESDPTGRTWQYKYSNAGLLTQVVDPLGGITEYRFDNQGRRNEVIDPAGRITRYEYDKRGRITKVIFPDSLVNTYTYDKAGNLIKETSNRGLDIQYEYNALGRVIRERRGSGLEISYQFDALGNQVEWQDNLGGGGSFRYNAQGLLSAAKDVKGSVHRYNYDLFARPVEEIDPLGHVTKRAYTPIGELAEMRIPTGETTKFKYDPVGNLNEIDHPGGGVTRFAYDPMGNRIELTDPTGAKTQSVYDKAGRLNRTTDAKRQTTAFSYDPAGRLMQKRLADGKMVNFKYDAAGNMIEIDDGFFPVRHTYDSRGLLIRIEYPAIKRSLEYRYEEVGLLSAFIDSEGRTINYEYDRNKFLNAIRLSDGQRIMFAYDAKGRLTTTVYPNGIKGTWEYDALDRAVRTMYVDKVGKTLAGWDYSYDPAGNLIKVVDWQGKIIHYRYDSAGQLVREERSNETARYSYLPGGNRGQLEREGKTIQYEYNKADQLLKSGEETFSYDSNGNLIERRGPQGITRYQYDVENRLTKVIKPDRAEVSFGYSPTGERIWRKDLNGLTYFVTDGTHVLAELDKNLLPIANYLHGPGIDRPLILVKDGQNHFYHADFLGSIAALTDSKGKISSSYQIDAFGNILEQKTSIHNPFIFTGREYEPELGLYYYRARYYDPRLGRFLMEDPAWDPSRLNPYTYARNTPTRYRDPLGLAEDEVLERHGLTQETFMKRLVVPKAKELRAIPIPKARPSDPEGMAKVMMRNQLELCPDELKGEPAIQKLRKSIAKTIKEYRAMERLTPEERVLRHQRALQRLEDFIAQQHAQQYKNLGATQAHVARPGELVPEREVSGQGAVPRAGVKTVIGAAPPESSTTGSQPAPPGTGEAAAGASESSSIVVSQKPGSQPNPRYRGPREMNTGVDNHNWQKLPVKQPGESSPAVPIVIHFLVTTEQIINCRNNNVSVSDCVINLIKSNVQWLAIEKVVLTSGSPAVMIALQIVGKGMMYFKLVSDTASLLYNMGSWVSAEWRRWNIEEERAKWTQANLRVRLEDDLGQMRAKINQQLDGPAKDFEMACKVLDKIVSDAAKYGNEAEREKGRLPSEEVVKKWTNIAPKCQKVSEMKGRLETIRSNVQGWTEKLKIDLEQAVVLSQSCQSKEDVDRIREGYRTCTAVLKGIQQRATEAKQLASELKAIQTEVKTVKTEVDKAMGVWDKIRALVDRLPSNDTLMAQIQKAEAAQKALMERGERLKAQVAGLQKGYPDDMKSEVEVKFFLLKDSVNKYQYTFKCDPQSYLSKYNEGAGKVVDAKLVAEQRLQSALTLQSELSQCDPGSIESFLDRINEMERTATSVMAVNKDLQQKAESCLAKLSGTKGGEGEKLPPLVQATKGKPPSGEERKSPGKEEKPPPLVMATKGKLKPEAKPTPQDEKAKVDLTPKFDPNKPYEIAATALKTKNVQCRVSLNATMSFEMLEGSPVIAVRQSGAEIIIEGKLATDVLLKKGFFRYQENCGSLGTALVATDRYKKFGPGITVGAEPTSKPSPKRSLTECLYKFCPMCKGQNLLGESMSHVEYDDEGHKKVYLDECGICKQSNRVNIDRCMYD